MGFDTFSAKNYILEGLNGKLFVSPETLLLVIIEPNIFPFKLHYTDDMEAVKHHKTSYILKKKNKLNKLKKQIKNSH